MEEIKLLQAIENDARISIADLADILNHSEMEVQAELEHLQAERVICGYHTVINWDKTSKEKVIALIEVNAIPERECGYDKVAEAIVGFPEVSSLYLMSGSFEFTVIIKGRTMREVADFVAQKLAPIDGVRGTITHFVMKQYKVEGIVIGSDQDEDERLVVTP